MKRKDAFGVIAALFLISTLFMPQDSNWWIYMLVIGVVFGILWLVWKE
ncbi:hypothetical protein HYT24_02165 [Candidatus Pacearchaeota archaeon]|nr:hypothetical protein [Candidatus Pacearchaeota archaeon]